MVEEGIYTAISWATLKNDRIEGIDAIVDDWDLTLSTLDVDGTCRVVRRVRV